METSLPSMIRPALPTLVSVYAGVSRTRDPGACDVACCASVAEATNASTTRRYLWWRISRLLMEILEVQGIALRATCVAGTGPCLVCSILARNDRRSHTSVYVAGGTHDVPTGGSPRYQRVSERCRALGAGDPSSRRAACYTSSHQWGVARRRVRCAGAADRQDGAPVALPVG